MERKYLSYFNGIVATLIVILLMASFFYYYRCQGTLILPEITEPERKLPVNAFSQDVEDVVFLDGPFVQLNFNAPTVRLPDLSKYLLYLGKNERPDADLSSLKMYFNLVGSSEPVSIYAGEKLYLIYDKTQSPPKYIFSPENQETSLWIVPYPIDKGSIVKLGLFDELGRQITEPAEFSELTLKEKDHLRFSVGKWQLGQWRVDGTLLARQRSRWYGKDVFLHKHGGDEYLTEQNKERIDFGDGEELYSVYVSPGDVIVWEDDKWVQREPGNLTQGLPLIMVNKADDRLMNLTLWDPEGKSKVILNLLKAHEIWMPQNILKSLKFIGMRTRSQFIFEVDGERQYFSPYDWFLYKEDGWKKLVHSDEIDAYVERKWTGPLLVIDSFDPSSNQPMLQITLYNSSRTDSKSFEFPLQLGSTPSLVVLDKTEDKQNKLNPSDEMGECFPIDFDDMDEEDEFDED